jgi:transcriptional regulator with XRE-family HTH domain
MTVNLGVAVGVNLRSIRRAYGQTQTEASKYLTKQGLDWSQATISQVESGKVKNISVGALLILSIAYNQPMWVWLRTGNNHLRLPNGKVCKRRQVEWAMGEKK